MKSIFAGAAVVVGGAVLGSFLGKLGAIAFPSGRFHNLFTQELTAGLHPTSLDLKLVDLTFGCIFHLDVMSIVGILTAAFLYKAVLK